MAKNMLARPAERQLENWIEAKWKGIEQMRPSRTELAEEATKALGYTVTAGNIKGAIAALGKTYHEKRRQGVSGKAKSYYAQLIQMLAREIRALLRRAGVRGATAFEDYCERMDQDERITTALSTLQPPPPDRPRVDPTAGGAGVSERRPPFQTRTSPNAPPRGGL